jgi:hypothetical protein
MFERLKAISKSLSFMMINEVLKKATLFRDDVFESIAMSFLDKLINNELV